MFNPWLFWAIKLKFLTGRACGRDQMERMSVVGLEADLKERLRTLRTLLFLNQIIFFVRTQTLD